jgi:1,4-dihydroxy-2-naphthoate octaprenyltransferase
MMVVVHWSVGGSVDVAIIYTAANIVFMGVGETLAKDLRDLINDGNTGKLTTPVAFGHRSVSIACIVAFAIGAMGYIVTAVSADANAGTIMGLSVVLALWCGRVVVIGIALADSYSYHHARDLHVGAVRVFLTANLLLIAGLSS